jgi:hypothetical protein
MKSISLLYQSLKLKKMKTTFIEVTRSGKKILLNTSFIVSITSGDGKNALITYLPTSSKSPIPGMPNAYPVEESYDDIKKMILGS